MKAKEVLFNSLMVEGVSAEDADMRIKVLADTTKEPQLRISIIREFINTLGYGDDTVEVLSKVARTNTENIIAIHENPCI